jgi:hypothetical protein
VNDELETLWKETAVTYFKILYQSLTKGTEETPSEKVNSPNQDWNPALSTTKHFLCVGFEVLTAVSTKMAVFWVVARVVW